jgi:hypothetical protein
MNQSNWDEEFAELESKNIFGSDGSFCYRRLLNGQRGHKVDDSLVDSVATKLTIA